MAEKYLADHGDLARFLLMSGAMSRRYDTSCRVAALEGAWMYRPKHHLMKLAHLSLTAVILAALLAPAAAESRPRLNRAPVSSYVKKHQTMDRRKEFSVASFNVQNLYRYRRGTVTALKAEAKAEAKAKASGRTSKKKIAKTANYLPKSPKAYDAKLKTLARTIVKNLKLPDVIALQEVENSKASAKRGFRPALEDLAREITAQSQRRGGGVEYKVAWNEGVSDRRGISQAFLYRTDRVRLAPRSREDPLLRHRPDSHKLNKRVANPKSFNQRAPESVAADGQGNTTMTRPLLAAKFEVFKNGVKRGGPSETFYVLNNHLKSIPNLFQDRRRAQAGLSADLVKHLLASAPDAKVIIAGDMNVDYNTPDQHRQLSALNRMTREDRRSATLLDNLTSRLNKGGRRSYDYRGKEQLLDWMFASKNLSRQLIEVRVPHVNSGAPDKETRGSDHDPVVARFKAFN